ncbi:hypothetical protein EP7_001724 [Isosphaeraceae bacterium EP7]
MMPHHAVELSDQPANPTHVQPAESDSFRLSEGCPSGHRFRHAVFVVLFLISPGSARSQCTPPKAIRPPAAALSFDVYRSDDAGRTWAGAGKGLLGTARVHALAIEGTTAYAATDEGLFISLDGGRLWAAREQTPASPVLCLTIAGRRIYAGTRKAGVFVTEDEGRSWRRVAHGLTDPHIRSLASRGSVVYAGTDSGGVFRLQAGDESWTPLGRGLPARPQVFDLAVKGQNLYAALYHNGLYRMNADGGNWERVGDVTPLRFLVRGHSLLAGHNPGGIHQSKDEGATWRLAPGVPDDAPIWVLGNAGPNVIAGTSPGAAALSDDLGATWKPGVSGLPAGSAIVAVGDGPSFTLAAIVRESERANAAPSK